MEHGVTWFKNGTCSINYWSVGESYLGHFYFYSHQQHLVFASILEFVACCDCDCVSNNEPPSVSSIAVLLGLLL